MGISNPLHIMFLLVIMLLVFGAKRLPEMGKSLGEGLRGFKSAIDGEHAPHEIAAHIATAPARPVPGSLQPGTASLQPGTASLQPEAASAQATTEGVRIAPDVHPPTEASSASLAHS